MKSVRIVPLLISVLALGIGASGSAMADGIHLGVNIGIPAPVYVAPAPVYAPPPPPVVYQPAPVYGAPVYGGPSMLIGWHGNRYWDGRRYWARDEWNRRHVSGRDWNHGDRGGNHGDRGGNYGDRGGNHGDRGGHNGWHN
jgi:hypothetical protein